MTAAYRWPTCCPVCGSRRIFTYQHDGSWFCASCDIDSTDTTGEQP